MLRKFAIVITIMAIVSLMACNSGSESTSTQGNQETQKKEETKTEQITLKFASYQPDTHFGVVNEQKPFAEKIEELTEGKVKVEFYPGEQLGKAKDMLSLVQTGAADMAYVSQSYVSGNMQLASVVSLPGLMKTELQGSKAASELLTSDPVLKNDFLKNGVYPLMASTSTSYELWTAKKQIKTVEDVKNMRIRSSGGSDNLFIESLGGVPTQTSAPEQYEAIEKGTIDGTLFTVTSIPSYHLNEVVKYATLGAGGGPNLGLIFINNDVWESMSSDIQDKIKQAASEVLDDYIAKLVKQADDIINEYKSNGDIEFYEVDRDAFSAATADVVNEWVEKNEAKGLPAKETLDHYKELLNKYEE